MLQDRISARNAFMDICEWFLFVDIKICLSGNVSVADRIK